MNESDFDDLILAALGADAMASGSDTAIPREEIIPPGSYDFGARPRPESFVMTGRFASRITVTSELLVQSPDRQLHRRFNFDRRVALTIRAEVTRD